MVGHNSPNKLSKKKVAKKKTSYPKIVVDKDNNFLSIKLKAGVEAKSYSRKGVLFSEDENGEIIELQVINL